VTFVISNLPASPTFEQQVQSAPDQYDFQALTNGDALTGVVTGCAVTQHGAGAMSVDIAAGVVAVTGIEVAVTAVSGQTVTAANGSNPRIDLVVVSSAGAVSITAGTAAANPVFPALTASQVLLAALYVGTSVTTILTADIQGKAVTTPPALMATNRLPASDRTIPASYSVVVAYDFEPVLNTNVEIGLLGALEIL
jgi:hypothetical protein